MIRPIEMHIHNAELRGWNGIVQASPWRGSHKLCGIRLATPQSAHREDNPDFVYINREMKKLDNPTNRKIQVTGFVITPDQMLELGRELIRVALEMKDGE